MQQVTKSKTIEVDQEGFQKALRPINARVSQVTETNTKNLFQVLHEEASYVNGVTEGGDNLAEVNEGRGGVPPIPHE